jgi:hypothetical protein
MNVGSSQCVEAMSARRIALLAELMVIAETKLWLSRFFAPLVLILKVYAVGYIAISCLLSQFAPTFDFGKTIFVPLFLAVMYGGFLWALVGDGLTRCTRKRIERIVSELGEDPKSAGALAQICYSAQFLSMAEVAATPLQRLLPRVTAEDAAGFSREEMQALLGLLATHNPHRVNLRQFDELPFAVLKALEQIGDSRAVEPVKRLTTGAANRRYHRAAQECLACIEQNGGQRDYNRSLLLPASAEGGKESLLRPAGGQAKTQPELLLRAVQDEEQG